MILNAIHMIHKSLVFLTGCKDQLSPWPTFLRSNILNANISEMITCEKNIKYNVYRFLYLPLNGTTANVVCATSIYYKCW